MAEMINQSDDTFKEILDDLVDFRKPDSTKHPYVKELHRSVRSRDSSSELGQTTSGSNGRTASAAESSAIRHKLAAVTSNLTNNHYNSHSYNQHHNHQQNQFNNNNNSNSLMAAHLNEQRNFHNHINDIINANNKSQQHSIDNRQQQSQQQNNYTHSHNNKNNNHMQLDKSSSTRISSSLLSSTSSTLSPSSNSNHLSPSGSKNQSTVVNCSPTASSLNNNAKARNAGGSDLTIATNSYSNSKNSEYDVKPASTMTSNVCANYPSSTASNSNNLTINYTNKNTQQSDDNDHIQSVEMVDLGKTAKFIEPNERDKLMVTSCPASKMGQVLHPRNSASRLISSDQLGESSILNNYSIDHSLNRNPLVKRDIKKRRKPEEKKILAKEIPGNFGEKHKDYTVEELTNFVENGNINPSTSKASQSNNRNKSNGGNSSNNTKSKSNTKHSSVTTNTQPASCNIKNPGNNNGSNQINQNTIGNGIGSGNNNNSRPMKKKKKTSNSLSTGNNNASSTSNNSGNSTINNGNAGASTTNSNSAVNFVEPSKPRTYADIAKNSNPSPTSSTRDTSPQHTKINSDASSTEVSTKEKSKQSDVVKDARPAAVVTFANHLNFKEDDMCQVKFGFFDDIAHNNSKTQNNTTKSATKTELEVEHVDSRENNNVKTSPISEKYFFKDNVNAKSFNYDQILKFISTAWERKERNKNDIHVKI